MRKHVIAAAYLVFTISTTAQLTWAADCQQSFYCYGNSGSNTTNTPMRPNPILRTDSERRATRIIARPNPQPQRSTTRITPRITPSIHAQPRARPTPAPPRASSGTVRVTIEPAPTTRTNNVSARTRPNARPSRNAQPRPIPNANNSCQLNKQRTLNKAASVESQAIQAARQNKPQDSIRLFTNAAQLRKIANAFTCN